MALTDDQVADDSAGTADSGAVAEAPFDAARVAEDFPLLHTEVNGRRLVYLDSAATSQKPAAVLDAMDRYYRTTNANVHRGVYTIAEQATAQLEEARAKVARFIRAPSVQEVVFTKNATEACNLIVHSWGRANLSPGDAVVLTLMEHHANIVPWHQLAAERGLELRWIGLTDDGRLDLSNLDELLDGARAIGLTAMSNVLGTLTPVAEIVARARDAGAVSLVDACQFVPHNATDVAAWGADFVAFSGHKMCGPTGIGVLWGRADLLDAMPPFLGGGEMIRDVTTEGFTCNDLPWKFEAGTPPIAEAIGLGAAVDYLETLGMDAVRAHEVELTAAAMALLADRFGDRLRIHGPASADARGGVLSMAFAGLHPHDIAQVLDEHNVCVRAGHHCAKPLMRSLGVAATARASIYVYNTLADIEALADALDATAEFFMV